MATDYCASVGIQPPKEAVSKGLSEAPTLFYRLSPHEGVPDIF